MNQYTPEALGSVIQEHREARGLTQVELGKAAGYSAASAGVSMSRLESGSLTTKVDRLAIIAEKLGLTWAELKAEAKAKSDAPATDDPNSALDHMRRASDERKQLEEAQAALVDASRRAADSFLEVLRGVAARIDGADLTHEPFSKAVGELEDGVSAEAAYQISFTRYGVQRALVAGVGPAGRSHFAEAVAIEAAAARSAREAARLSASARRGLLAAMGVAARPPLPGGGLLAGAAMTATIAVLLERSRTQRARLKKESAARLAEIEEDLARTQPNVDALAVVIPRAIELHEYVATHAGHAVMRWRAAVGQGSIDWESLDAVQRNRYFEFVEIAAAHLAVASIDLHALATSTGQDLQHAVSLADQILEQSREAIAALV